MLYRSLQLSGRRCAGLLGLAIGFSMLSWSQQSSAHFTLIKPASWVVEDSFGNPQKLAPCGGDNVVTSGDVTTFRVGSTIQVRWQETVGHPGHFRISLAKNRADLKDPVVVTTNGDGETGLSLTAEIVDPPAYPVLMDNLFPREGIVNAHDEPFEVDVKLPNETCEACTLQVIQFMANHEPNFFYHHCADIKLVAADAPVPPPPVSVNDDPPEDSGGCSIGPGEAAPVPGALLLALGFAGLFLRRLRAVPARGR